MKKLDDLHYKDLYFREKKVLVAMRELDRLKYIKTVPVTGWRQALGDFMGPESPGYDDSEWTPFGETDRFGDADQYGWFRINLTIPAELKGFCTALNIKSTIDGDDDPLSRWNDANPGFLCYINGSLVGHYDRFHKTILLSECAQGGETFCVALKYWTENGSSDYFCPVLRAIDKKTEELFYDLRVAHDWAMQLGLQDGMQMKIIAPVAQALDLLDMRNPYSDEYYSSVAAAHDCIMKNGYESESWTGSALDATVFCVGHSHIDVAWMWRMRQTREKAQRTFVNALNYIDCDPDYTFFCSQAAVYDFVRNDNPELYARVKKAVASGRWEADGGMWVEADCNLTSGEGFVRQFLYGTRFFRDEFHVKCKMLWLPDVFGYSAALPQILKGFDLDYFTTAKINNNEYNCMPHDTFMWQGIDGSEVFAHLITGQRLTSVETGDFSTAYNTEVSPNFLNGAWRHYHDKELGNELFMPVGWGDGGGGTADYMLEYGKRMKAGLPMSVRCDWGRVDDWFEKWSKKLESNKYLPKWAGELYFERHRGTLTSMGRIKKKNRKSELLYQKAEWLSVLNSLLCGGSYPKDSFDEGWKMLLVNQFHDILPGSSIKPVYDDADADYEKVFKIGNEAAGSALSSLAGAICGDSGEIVVFNPAGFDRFDAVFAETNAAGIEGAPSQRTSDGRLCFMADLPSKGWAVFTPCDNPPEGKTVSFENNVIESPFFTVKLDENGFFSFVFDRENNREVLLPGKPGNLLRAYEDMPVNDDAWDINVFYREKFEDVTELISCELVENGPVYAVIRQVRRFNRSSISQDIRFYRHIPRIDFITTADWHETNILLKAHFPIDVNTDKATYEIQFGAITRNTHENTMWDFAKFEVCGHKWADISEGDYGAAVLNDCKYGYSARGSDLSLSLIKCAAGPNVDADREVHSFTYSFMPHRGGVMSSDVIKQGYMLNAEPEAEVKRENGGTLPRRFSLVTDTANACVIDSVKRAEDDEGIIIRLYEPRGQRARARLEFGLEPVEISMVNLAEEKIRDLKAEPDGALALPLGAFEIISLKLTLSKKGRA